MIKVDFKHLERFEGVRGQGFSVVVQRRKLSNAYVSSLFRIMLDEVFEVVFDAEMWAKEIAEVDMQRVWDSFAEIQRVTDGQIRAQESGEVNSDALDDVRRWANTQWPVLNADLAGFKPLSSAEVERIEKHFERLFKHFAKARKTALKRLKPSTEVEILPLQNVQDLQVKRNLLYLRPLDPVHLALCVTLSQVSPAKAFIEVEIGLCQVNALNNAPDDFITLRALKGESVPVDIIIHASICPICGNLSEDGKLCRTCRADKHYLKKVLNLLKEDEKQAFLNGTLNLDELWKELKEQELKLYSEANLTYRLKTLYHKAPKLIPYLEQNV